MFKQLIDCLKEKKMTIGSVESLTAGLFTSSIASVSGASSVLRGGLVTYASEVKTILANVDPKVIEKEGVVSEDVARQMAVGGSKVMGTNVTISFTGNAGPDVLDNKEVGEVYIGIKINDKIYVEHQIFSGTRNEIRVKVCEFGCNKIIELLNNY